MPEKIAVIGAGQMGSAMARRLGEVGCEVIAYDINESIREALAADGMNVAGSLSEALAGRSLVLTSLPDPNAVREAWLGDDGIVALAESDSLLMDLSTIDPETMQAVGEAAQARGLQVIDCPVSGSPNEAGSGKLVLLVGGEKEAIERVEPILGHLGTTWRHTGPVGTAKVVKIVNNMMSMGNVLIAAEAFALGVAAGVEPEKLYDVISVSGGRSHHFTKRFPGGV